MIVLLTTDDAIAGFSGECVEGKISIFDKETLTVKFSRMSPEISCKFDLKVDRPTSLNYQIIADDRLSPKIPLWPLLVVIISTVIPVLVILADAYLVYVVFRKKIYNSLYWLDMHKHNVRKHWERFKLSGNDEEIKEFVKIEYEISINSVDATILEYVHAKKTTLAQLTSNTHISRWHIKFRMAILLKWELLSSDKKNVHESLADHFDKINKRNGGQTTS